MRRAQLKPSISKALCKRAKERVQMAGRLATSLFLVYRHGKEYCRAFPGEDARTPVCPAQAGAEGPAKVPPCGGAAFNMLS